MILKVGEETWHLHIHHEFLGDDSLLPRKRRRSWDVVTKALVHSGICVMAAGPQKYCVNGLSGEARCSKKDNFVRAVGAKEALRLALYKLPREVREAIWQAYWQRVRRPKERSEKFKRRIQQAT